MASFLEELWNSVFTPGTTPTLLIATNASFAALQFLLLILLVATYSIHFVVLSVLSAALWYAINWFAREIQLESAKATAEEAQKKREKSPEAGSDTETEAGPPSTKSGPRDISKVVSDRSHTPSSALGDDLNLRRRRSIGDHSSSGYVSTDSEWEKVSEGENR